ncbi:MAG: hypothetical protein QXW83_05655 [Nitrososphaerales archaeon]
MFYELQFTYLGVVIIGLLHGIEPCHGWPIALSYAWVGKQRLLRGFISSAILSIFHLISSIAVVAVYALLNLYITIHTPEFKYIAAGLLLYLAYRFFKEKSKDEKHTNERLRKIPLTLKELSIYAFILGFAHEEEFVLLALAIGGINPWLLMLSYALAVTIGLIGITIAILTAFKAAEGKIKRYEWLLPNLTGVVLIILAISILLGLWI